MWYKIKRFFIRKFGNILVYRFPLFVMFGHTSYQMKGKDVREVLNTIQPGDILLRRYNNYISGLLIPGYYTHSAIYIGNNEIIHMLGDGINKQDILTFCSCDSITIIHCIVEQISKEAVNKATELFNKGVEYDYDFDFSNDTRFSCTELIDYLYDKPKIVRKKEKYIIPDDFLTLDELIFKISYQKG